MDNPNCADTSDPTYRSGEAEVCEHARSHRTATGKCPPQERLPLSASAHATTQPTHTRMRQNMAHGTGRKRRVPLRQALWASVRLRTSVMPTLHRTASCFKLGFPGVGELRPSQQAPGIAVRVSLRRREHSSDVPYSEPPLQGSPRPSMPRVENRCSRWTCTVRCLHCMACGTCAHAHAGV